jgi:hypothetical protein
MDPFALLSLLKKVDRSYSSLTNLNSDSENTHFKVENTNQINDTDEIINDFYNNEEDLEKEAVKLVQEDCLSEEEQKDTLKPDVTFSLPQRELINKGTIKRESNLQLFICSKKVDSLVIDKLEI